MNEHLSNERCKRHRATEFVERWHGRGSEKSDTQQFWMDLLSQVVGMENATTSVRFERATADHGWIDVVIPDAKTVVEQKSADVDLDKAALRQGQTVTPFEQAKRYADSLPNSQRPDTIIVCNFDTFRLHDLDQDIPAIPYAEFTLQELPDQLHLLDFLVQPQLERRLREERVSLEAGKLVGELYGLLREEYHDPDTQESRHALNVLCVRIVFCLFAEDAGIFPKDAFNQYLSGMPASQVRSALRELFAYLNTPPGDRDPYSAETLVAFPYVNGGLFEADVAIPNFTPRITALLVDTISRGTNWADISPTVFGGVFESTLNPETRRGAGMHYTSQANIHKLIDPLFLDDLTAELARILEAPGVGERKRRTQLQRFHDKLASLTFFDPACGSGNFLTETYVSLRRLENQVLSALQHDQITLGLDEDHSPLKVGLHQFHGIEINDFAVNVATTSLWIAELQANAEAQTIVHGVIQDLPLDASANIVLGNALQMDWAQVVNPSECDYVIGNPPFRGARYQEPEQKAELQAVFAGARNTGNIDYVAGWFMKAAQFAKGLAVRVAFVATNSICQGEQVANIWSPIFELGHAIDFAHDTFRWENDSVSDARVFVVIVGFSQLGGDKRLFHYERVDGDYDMREVEQLNAYLRDAPQVFVWNRNRPINDVPAMGIGNQPIDGGHYLFTADERVRFLEDEPAAALLFRRWYGSKEFLQGVERWVLWTGDTPPETLATMPRVVERINAVQKFRQQSKRASTQKLARTPTRFQVENMPSGSSILVPKVSSERRTRVPMGYIGCQSLASDLVFLLPDGSLYDFGILQSRVHNAWIRTVAGRHEGRLRYGKGTVYNTFAWPKVTEQQQEQIASCAEAVLQARRQYTDTTLAVMYDPEHEALFADLFAAHGELDAAVEQAYGLEPGIPEDDLVARLFQLYVAATAAEE